jgi:hypothetical protein
LTLQKVESRTYARKSESPNAISAGAVLDAAIASVAAVYLSRRLLTLPKARSPWRVAGEYFWSSLGEGG